MKKSGIVIFAVLALGLLLEASQALAGTLYVTAGLGSGKSPYYLHPQEAINPAAVTLPATIIFAHMAIGGGFSTIFTILNTGSTPVEGNLILTGQDGKPLSATLAGSMGAANETAFDQVTASSIPITIAPGGVKFVTASALSPNDPQKAGWARLESTGGAPGGVAAFQFVSGGKLSAIAGVLAADIVENATIPLDDDVAANRFTGYAVANPSTDTVTIRVVTVKEDGTAGATLQSIKLAPGEQKAQFVYQDPSAGAKFKFKGSVVLMGQSGKKFSIVALVQNQNLYTAIPVIPAKAPTVTVPSEIATPVGNLVITGVEVGDRFPPGCSPPGTPFCSLALPGFRVLVVWLAKSPENTSSNYSVSDYVMRNFGAVSVEARNGSKTGGFSGGMESGRLFVAFTPPAIDSGFKLLWPGNAPIDLGK